jgi:molecular chaperone GrpE
MSKESDEPRATSHEPEADDTSSPQGGGEGGSAAELAIEVDPVAPTAHDLGLELPGDHDEAEALLLRELAESRMEAGETLENLQRLAAEFDNFRRRVERDHAENVERASQRVIESLLPTLDAFDAALAIEPHSESEERILDGMRSTRAQLLETLIRDGFGAIPALGERFDPKVHEAVSGAQGGDGDLVVSSELRRGYTMRGRVLRPTLVTVDHA